MDWLLPAFFLAGLSVCAFFWWRYDRSHPNRGPRIAPGESRWWSILWLMSGPVLSALIAIGVSWLLSGSFPNDTAIIAAVGAATGGAIVVLMRARSAHSEA